MVELIYKIMGHANLVDKPNTENYPSFLKKASGSISNKPADDHPKVVDMSAPGAAKKLDTLISSSNIFKVVDNYDEQYAELLLSKNPHLYRANYSVQKESIREMLDEHYGGKEPWQLGSWVYFPWDGNLVHILNKNDYEELRTIRNRELITSKEQKILSEFSVACFGMSVGSAGALALAITGIANRIKLVDGAVISGSNLNRILTGVSSVGENKCRVIGRMIYEMNPYVNVEYYDKVTSENIGDIIGGEHPVNLTIDEIDDIEMKVRIRIESKKRKTPVLMASELADTVMLDVERYDLEPNRRIFHGKVKGVEKVAERPPENYREWTRLAVGIMNPKNMPLKLQKSVLKIGTSIVTHPQLGSTVMLTGGMLAFCAKNIALNNKLKSGRYVISLENELLEDHKTIRHNIRHRRHTRVIKKSVNSMK